MFRTSVLRVWVHLFALLSGGLAHSWRYPSPPQLPGVGTAPLGPRQAAGLTQLPAVTLWLLQGGLLSLVAVLTPFDLQPRFGPELCAQDRGQSRGAVGLGLRLHCARPREALPPQWVLCMGTLVPCACGSLPRLRGPSPGSEPSSKAHTLPSWAGGSSCWAGRPAAPPSPLFA